jgi:hypothetical protein
MVRESPELLPVLRHLDGNMKTKQAPARV